MNTLETLQNLLKARIESARNELAKFQERFSKDPTYAFSWAESAMTAAAMEQVATSILETFTEDGGHRAAFHAQWILKEGARKMEALVRNPPRSTSPCHNIMAQLEAKAWADLLEEGKTIRDCLILLSSGTVG